MFFQRKAAVQQYLIFFPEFLVIFRSIEVRLFNCVIFGHVVVHDRALHFLQVKSVDHSAKRCVKGVGGVARASDGVVDDAVVDDVVDVVVVVVNVVHVVVVGDVVNDAFESKLSANDSSYVEGIRVRMEAELRKDARRI